MSCLSWWFAFDLLFSCLFNVCAFLLLSLPKPPVAPAAGANSGAGSRSSGEGAGGLDVGDDVDDDNDDAWLFDDMA